jgi:hypothetical protein
LFLRDMNLNFKGTDYIGRFKHRMMTAMKFETDTSASTRGGSRISS